MGDSNGKVIVPEIEYYTETVHHDTYERISPLGARSSLQGKNVVVTGGGTGIGKAIAIAFAQAGAKSVSILGRREAPLKATLLDLEKATPYSTSIFKYEICDLIQRDQVDKALDAIVDTIGSIDVLVSNAGSLQDLVPIAKFNASDFMHGFELNVLTTLNVVQAFLKRHGRDSVIINVSSCIAHMRPMPNVSGYAVSKAANLKLMDYFAFENPEIRVFNLQPGTCETDMQTKAGVPAKDKGALLTVTITIYANTNS